MSEAREKYVCFISYLCKKYILLSFHNTYVILFHINYWKFISGRGGSVNTLHKLKRNIALVIIFFMFTVKPLTFRMEKSANYPYHLLRMIYSFYIYAGTAPFGGSHPNAFNFFKYAWIFRSALN